MTPLEGGRQVPLVGRGVRGVDVHGPLPLPTPEEEARIRAIVSTYLTHH